MTKKKKTPAELEAEDIGRRIDAGTLSQAQAAGIGAMIAMPPVRMPKPVDYPSPDAGVGLKDPLTGAPSYTKLDMGRFKRNLTGEEGSVVVDAAGNVYTLRGRPPVSSSRYDPVRDQTVDMIRSGSVAPTQGERDWPFTHVPYRGKPHTMTPGMDAAIGAYGRQDAAGKELESLEVEAQHRLMQIPGALDNVSPQVWRAMIDGTVAQIRRERAGGDIAADTARRGERADAYRTAGVLRETLLDAGMGGAPAYTPGRDPIVFKGLTQKELDASPEQIGEIALERVAAQMGVDPRVMRQNLASSSPNLEYRERVAREQSRIELSQAEARQDSGSMTPGRPATRQQMMLVNDPAQAFRELDEKLQRVSYNNRGKVKPLARKQVRKEISEAIAMLDPEMIEGLTDADKGELTQLVRAGRQGTVAQPEHLLQAINNVLRRVNPARAQKEREAQRKVSRETQLTIEKERRATAEWDRRQAIQREEQLQDAGAKRQHDLAIAHVKAEKKAQEERTKPLMTKGNAAEKVNNLVWGVLDPRDPDTALVPGWNFDNRSQGDSVKAKGFMRERFDDVLSRYGPTGHGFSREQVIRLFDIAIKNPPDLRATPLASAAWGAVKEDLVAEGEVAAEAAPAETAPVDKFAEIDVVDKDGAKVPMPAKGEQLSKEQARALWEFCGKDQAKCLRIAAAKGWTLPEVK